MDAIVSGERFRFDHRVPGLSQAFGESLQILDQKRGMGFAGRAEVVFDSEMDADRVVLEPQASTNG
jgi:hypothetical protein